MRAVVMRVKEASVTINGEVRAQIGKGLLVLLGVAPKDTEKEAAYLADRITGVRIFADELGKMNLNLAAVSGALLVVSQFTLYADLKSRRPGFTKAAKPETAAPHDHHRFTRSLWRSAESAALRSGRASLGRICRLLPSTTDR